VLNLRTSLNAASMILGFVMPFMPAAAASAQSTTKVFAMQALMRGSAEAARGAK
jgi:hypothetical protein